MATHPSATEHVSSKLDLGVTVMCTALSTFNYIVREKPEVTHNSPDKEGVSHFIPMNTRGQVAVLPTRPC
jgi:hypothetical protein